MKCLLIASESAEVLFHWTDPEFQQNVQKQYGASQEDGQGLPAFEDSISTLFAPIIISCITMVDRLRDSYTSFTTENHHIYVLHQFDECLYIAVNGDGEEGECDLRRKIYVVKKMTEVLFGMVTLSSNLLRKELRPQDTEQRARLWKHLQSLLQTYGHLRENDQSFLVEAVERLIHPTLCEQCIEFLERRLVQQLNSSGERAGEEVMHAFILVHTKLLAFYSSRNASSLSTSDLLVLIIMAQNMYPSNTDSDDPNPEVENDRRTSGSGPESFYTPEPSPPPDRGSSSSGGFCGRCCSVYSYLVSHLSFAFAKLEKRLSEGQEGSAATRGQRTIHEVRGKLDKFIKALGPTEIQVCWIEFKNLAFTRGGPGFSRHLIPSCKKMKTQLCAVYRQCFLLESGSSSIPQRLSPGLQERAQSMVQEKLMDWKDFLLVKSRRNITMDFPGLIHFICVDRSTGQMIAPSLNLTERNTSELGKGPLAQFIRRKVWTLVNTTRRYLQKGYSTVTFRDGDFYFCYFLWFENETGFKLEAGDLPVLSDDSAPIGMLAWDYYRKLLRYYSKSHQGEVVKCYELLTVHLGVVPAEIILQHCRQLASKLWEPSRNPLL
uniref:HPS1 biogenesis of lysosomal organelles complex 3 subunit 1 n=1 Tax=Gasterosteus aculeatus aculeatus TaxID=481459 RepID=A0AAQ4R5F0_GASAC